VTTADVLTSRALNRATLERQLLLSRSSIPVVDAVEHLVGLQAQVPDNPYLGLWSRLDRFDPEELSRLMVDRTVVRAVVLRGTIHLVSVADALLLRPLEQPVLDAELARHRDHAPHLFGVDLRPVLAFARELLAVEPLDGRRLRAALAREFPRLDAAALAYACRNHLTLVQVPPRGLWRRSGQVTTTTIEAWTGRQLEADPSIEGVVTRYLGAFGPATVTDVATWSRLGGLADVLERLRPRLRVFRDERGRELFDLPHAPRPDPSVPAPPRFLPEYDNVLLSHADRGRFVTEVDRRRLTAGPRAAHGSLLVDGMLAATWRVDGPTLVVDHLRPLARRTSDRIAAEGRRLMRLVRPGEAGDVRFELVP
jgi:hypothetical protein